MSNRLEKTEDWYEASYREEGFDSQRRYPNEELLRFMGRNFFAIPSELRKETRILELGCGSCANLWMVASEGFKAYGLDLSAEAIRLGKIMLDHWGAEAELQTGDMTQLPYEDNSFEAILDVFSSYCLPEMDFRLCLDEVERVLKPGGQFFCYTPGKESGAFQNHLPSSMIDASTLDGIRRKGSPFFGNHYPYRFVNPEELRHEVEQADMEVCYLETVHRTYFNSQEIFEHVVMEAKKQSV